MKRTNKFIDIIEKIKECLDLLFELERYENITQSNAAKSRKIGKQLDNYTKILISNIDGINHYKKLLESENYIYKWDAAINLFPLYPTKCLTVMIHALSICNNSTPFEKDDMITVIDAYKKDLNDKNIFFDRLRKLYGTEDLKSLNLE